MGAVDPIRSATSSALHDMGQVRNALPFPYPKAVNVAIMLSSIFRGSFLLLSAIGLRDFGCVLPGGMDSLYCLVTKRQASPFAVPGIQMDSLDNCDILDFLRESEAKAMGHASVPTGSREKFFGLPYLQRRVYMYRSVCVLVLALAVSFSLFSDENKDKKKEEKLEIMFEDSIVVTGEVVSETATVSQVTAKEIQARGAKNIAEALRLIPGTHVRTGSKGEAYIRLRGFNQRNVALLIDGIPISSPYDGQLDLNTIPTDYIERIEVVRGAASVMYGADAMGGVVNIITKKSTGASAVHLNAELGTGKTADLGVGLQGSVQKIRYLLTGNYYNQDYFTLAKDYQTNKTQPDDKRLNSDRKVFNGQLTLGWDMGQKGKAAVTFRHVDQERGFPVDDYVSKPKYWRFNDWQQGGVDFLYDVDSHLGSFKIKAYYEYMNNVLDSYDDATFTTQDGKNGYTDTMKNSAVGADVFFKKRFGEKLFAKTALRFRYDHNDRQGDVGEEWEHYNQEILSVPLEFEYKLLKSFTITAGSSVDFKFFKRPDNYERETISAFNPQAAVLFSATDALRFKAAVSRKTCFPTMRELFSGTSGNPDLEPMKTMIYELGMEFDASADFTLSASVFKNDVKNLIARKNKDDIYRNIEEAEFKGFECGFNWSLSSIFTIQSYYTYLESKDKTSITQDSVSYRPKHKIDLSGIVSLPADILLSVNLSSVSSQTYYDGDEAKKLDPFAVLDMKMSKSLGKSLSVHLTVKNLFDKNYYESEGNPRPGRMVYAGLSATL